VARSKLVSRLKIAFALLLGLAALILAGARFGLFAGLPPNDLGIHAGRLKPPSLTRNSVSSQADLYPNNPQRDYARIAPLPLRNGDANTSMRTLADVLAKMPDIQIVTQQADYIYAEARTPWLQFVDDLEFWLDPKNGVIQLRSASRMGREDFGVNRQRMERIRAAYLAVRNVQSE